MRPSSTTSLLMPAIIIVAGFAAVFALSEKAESARPSLPEHYSDSDLYVNGSRLKGFAFGAEGLLADWYYMRSLQYIGDKLLKVPDQQINIEDLSHLNPRLLYPLLDTATDLDPHFIEAYSYGAVVLPAIDKEKAIALVNKGIAHNPDSWRLYQHLGYIYWKLGQYEKAADTYSQGAEIRGAAPFMRLMAAAMKDEAGSRETARAIYREMYDGSDDPMVRTTATRRLQEIESMDERDAMNKALAEQRERTGRCPATMKEIVAQLLKVRLPADNEFEVNAAGHLVDPSGTPYLLDSATCTSQVDRKNTGLFITK
jgi:tetratricopeptide (TPR) repeat protein